MKTEDARTADTKVREKLSRSHWGIAAKSSIVFLTIIAAVAIPVLWAVHALGVERIDKLLIAPGWILISTIAAHRGTVAYCRRKSNELHVEMSRDEWRGDCAPDLSDYYLKRRSDITFIGLTIFFVVYMGLLAPVFAIIAFVAALPYLLMAFIFFPWGLVCYWCARYVHSLYQEDRMRKLRDDITTHP